VHWLAPKGQKTSPADAKYGAVRVDRRVSTFLPATLPVTAPYAAFLLRKPESAKLVKKVLRLVAPQNALRSVEMPLNVFAPMRAPANVSITRW